MIKAQDMQVFEILDQVDRAVEADRVTVFKKYQDHSPLGYILKWNFDDSIVSILPEGVPPYNSAEEDGPSSGSLWGALRLFPLFVKSAQSAKMRLIQIEKQFIDLIEHLDPREVEVLCAAKDGTLQTIYSNITLDLVQEAFPGLIAAPTTKVVKELTDEEKAQKLVTLADEKKAKAKALQAEAKEHIKEANALLAGA